MEGKILSAGLAKGVAVVMGYELQRRIALPQPDEADSILRADVDAECGRMDDALDRSKDDLNDRNALARDKPSIAAAVELVSVHAAMASEMASLVKERISSNLVGVEEALDSVICQSVSRLQKIDNDYLREREADVRDVGGRMMRHLIGVGPTDESALPPNSIVVARELVPSHAIGLANSKVVGIVTQFGGKLGHTAIIARSLGIPAVSGVLNVTQRITSGMTLLIDAEAGVVTADPTEDQLAKFAARMVDFERGCEDANERADNQRRSRTRQSLGCTRSPKSGDFGYINNDRDFTLDGTEIPLYGNVGLQTDLDQVLRRGLAGVGLFRTEFLYLQSQERPDAESQRHLYAEMAERLGDRPLVIRTFDLGGDKLPPFLSLDQNLDPSSLNLRGLRFSLGEQHLLRAQLTAIVQVAQSSEVKILLPMVIGGDDFSQAIAVVEEVMKDCGALRRPPIGAMIETPAALFCLDEILELADFIAIGTNDLTQYLLAADRELSSESDAFTAMHPAVLRAIKQIMVAAKRWDCPVTVCGEEAGEPEFAELLIGLGVRALSVSPSQESRMRTAIAEMDRMDATELVERALVCRSPREVREHLSAIRSSFDAKENQSSPHMLGVSP